MQAFFSLTLQVPTISLGALVPYIVGTWGVKVFFKVHNVYVRLFEPEPYKP